MKTLLLMVDESPLTVDWRTPDGRNRPGHVWVSQDCWDTVGAAADLGGMIGKVAWLGISLTQCSQLCDLPAASLNDQLPQHTFRIIWTAGNIQKECVLLKGDATCSSPLPLFLSWVSPPATYSFFQATKRAGAETQPQMSSSSGDDREACLQERTLGIRQLGWEAGASGRWSQPG